MTLSKSPLPEEAQALSASCFAWGLDICRPFSVQRVNSELSEFVLPDFDREPLGLLIGNSRALWPSVRPRLLTRREEHPLDHYVEGALHEALRRLSCRFWVGFAHSVQAPVIPIQRIALLAGLADLAPVHLSVHPAYGPWFALRAVVVLDHESEGWAPERVSICAHCSKPCVPAFDAARAEGEPTAENLRAHADRWLAVRDVCPVGRAERYSDEQIAYHYKGLHPISKGS